MDLQADVSAIQAVGPQTSREEIRDLYYEVYKLRRLPGSPPCGPEWKEELVGDVVSSLKGCLRWIGANHQEDQKSLNWQLPTHHGARPPEEGGGTLLPKETSPRQGKPIEEPSSHGHLGGKNRKAEPISH